MHRKGVILVALAALLLAFVTIPSFSQTSGRIAGVVTDKETGEPLAGANVLIVGTSYGAATDMNGEFLILNVSVGTYSIKATYMGYADVTQENVIVNIGLTTRLNFEMSSKAIQAEAVTIVAPKPLIQPTSTNASRIIDASEIANLPVRGVDAAANLQPGIIAQDGEIYIRGGRSDEVTTYVDGASVRDLMTGDTRGTVIPEALEELQIQAGGYEAQYGGANSGIIAMAIRAGAPSYQFSVRGETDNFAEYGEKFLDTYSRHYSDYSVTASGPIPGLGDHFRFFVAGENQFIRDRDIMFWEPFTLKDGQILEDGSALSLADNGSSGGLVGEVVPNGEITWGGVHPQFNWNNTFTYNAVITADFKNLKFRFSGIGSYEKEPSDGFDLHEQFSGRYEMQQSSFQTYTLKMTHILSPKTYYEISGIYHDGRVKWWDPDFKENYWVYRDSLANAEIGYDNFSSYYGYSGVGPNYYNLYGFTFERPGTRNSDYGFTHRSYIGGKLDFTHQYKRHQVQFGGDFQLWDMRRYVDLYFDIQALRDDPDKLNNYANDPETFEKWARNIRDNVYGYDRLGNRRDDLSPWDQARKPLIISAYLQDRYEYKDLIINAGLRFDYHNMDQYEPDDYLNPAVDATNNSLDPDGWSKVDPFTSISPRLGFGFPVTDNTVFHMQWGKFVQMPQMTQGYRSQSMIYKQLYGGYFYSDPVAFVTEPEKTTQYEIGFSQMLGTNASFDATLFYKDIKNQLQTRRVFTSSDAVATSYDMTQNGDFATTKGMEFRFTLRRTSRIQGWVNYTYSDARGTGSYVTQSSASLDQGTSQVAIITPLYFNQTHKGNFSVDYRFDKGDGGPVLEQIGLNLMFNFSSGHPYTLSTGEIGQNAASEGGVLEDYDARARRPLEPVGASTTPWQFTLDARLDKTLNFGRFDITVFAYAQNLLNTKNVINVYPRTGSDTDGFLNDPNLSGTIIAAQGQGYAELYRKMNNGNRQHYFTNFRGEDLWSRPRQIRAGVMINFQ